MRPSSQTVHPFLPCRVHVPVALHEFDGYSTVSFLDFFWFVFQSQTFDPLGYDKCSTTSDKKFEFMTFSFAIVCVQCLFSY